MDPTRWARIKELFEDAADLSGEERASFLDEHCRADPELREEVESLLAADARTPEVLESPAFEGYTLLAQEDGFSPGQHVGSYRLVERIATGGMGTVWRAVLVEQPELQVAIKFVRRGFQAPNVLRRFATERRLLANLEHPNIARLLDGDVTEDGLPFLVMEFIDGEPIHRWCDRKELGVDERLRLVLEVCEAVHHAHRNLVVHRDLKPDNILVTAAGTVKLLDFGISKILHPDTGAVTATATGFRPMTPQYASPEQLRGEAVTTASDVYSLGLILYELLTGRRPYRVPTVVPEEAARMVTTAVLEPPSQAVLEPLTETAPDGSTRIVAPADVVSRRRGGARPEALSRRLQDDLDNIILMALRKEVERRYASAAQLAEDLDRHLRGLPVIARRDTFRYRMGKLMRRHRLGVAAGLLVLASVLAGMIGILWQKRVADREARYARSEAESLHRVVDFLTGLFHAADPAVSGGAEVTVTEVLERGAGDIEHQLGDQPAVRSALLDALGTAFMEQGRLQRAEPLLLEALEIRKDIYPPGHQEIAESLHAFGVLRREQGRFREAAELLQRARTMWADQWGDRALDVASVENDLGLTLLELDELDRAEALFRQVLATRQAALGADHPKILSAMNNLSGVLYQKRELPEAEAILREVVARVRRIHVKDHPDLATNIANLGLILHEEGKLEEAGDLYDEALAIRRRLYGPEDHRVAQMLNNIGGLRFVRGDFAGAAEVFREAIRISGRSWPPEHPLLAQMHLNLARSLWRGGDAPAAVPLLEDALARLEGALPPGHVLFENLHETLGRILLEQGEAAGAVSHLQAAVDALQAAERGTGPVLAEVLVLLGKALIEARRPEEAAAPLRAARDWYARNGNPDAGKVPDLDALLRGIHKM